MDDSQFYIVLPLPKKLLFIGSNGPKSEPSTNPQLVPKRRDAEASFRLWALERNSHSSSKGPGTHHTVQGEAV